MGKLEKTTVPHNCYYNSLLLSTLTPMNNNALHTLPVNRVFSSPGATLIHNI